MSAHDIQRQYDLVFEVAEAAREWSHLERQTGVPIRKDQQRKARFNIHQAIENLEEWENDLHQEAQHQQAWQQQIEDEMFPGTYEQLDRLPGEGK